MEKNPSNIYKVLLVYSYIMHILKYQKASSHINYVKVLAIYSQRRYFNNFTVFIALKWNTFEDKTLRNFHISFQQKLKKKRIEFMVFKLAIDSFLHFSENKLPLCNGFCISLWIKCVQTGVLHMKNGIEFVG